MDIRRNHEGGSMNERVRPQLSTVSVTTNGSFVITMFGGDTSATRSYIIPAPVWKPLLYMEVKKDEAKQLQSNE